MKNTFFSAVLLGAMACAPALADFDYTYTTTGTGTAGSAEFVLTGTSLQITITNLNTTFSDPAPLIHGVNFTTTAGSVSTTSHPTAVSYATTAGVNSWNCTGAKCVPNTTLALPTITEWDLFHSSSYDVNDFAGSSKPGIGNFHVNNVVPNGGLANDHVNPVLNTTTFTFTVSSNFAMSQTAGTVGLQFGTSQDITAASTEVTVGTLSNTPEPAFYGVLSLGLLGLVIVRRRSVAR